MKMSPEDRLREALRAQVDTVEVGPDALPRIRRRIADRRRGGWAVLVAAAGVAAVIALAVVVFVPDRGPSPEGLPAASATPTAAPVTADPGPVRSEPSVPSRVRLPVYYARNDRLVREFHELTLAAEGDGPRIGAAVAESLRQGSAYDPDYVSLWPDTVSLRALTVQDRVVVVDLADVGPGARGGSAAMAVQQLVSTVSAAATYTSVKKIDGVRLLVDGRPAEKLWNAVDVSRQLRPGPPSEIYAPVWVIDPQQGQLVGKSFTVHLAGTVFEGTVNLRVRAADGKMVAEQVVQLDAGAPAVGEARVPLTLPAGRYMIEAYFLSPVDGSVQGVDDHEFSVG